MAETYEHLEMDMESLLKDLTLEDWVLDKAQEWRRHYEEKYQEKDEEYYRIWRGIFDPSDKVRATERSKLIAPATQQAVESSVAELEEATFGRGKWFDIIDNVGDSQKIDIQQLRNKLSEEFSRNRVRQGILEVLINAAVSGTGIGEIVVDEEQQMTPAQRPSADGTLTAYGVEIQDTPVVKLKPVMNKHFLIDPVATCVDDALGCAIDEYVSPHIVEELQESGVYKKVHVGTAAPDEDLLPDQDITAADDDKVRLLRYYGLVPTKLLKKSEGADGDGDVLEDVKESEEGYYTEAIVVIANNGTLLKAVPNPYMMNDRPVIAFQWDVVPGMFRGRGVVEKAYNPQKALDAEMRARIDSLALTAHPMMAMDSTRLPRGFRAEVKPGKVFLTQGNPSEIMMPFKFGSENQITFAQAATLQQMVQEATGAVDSTGLLSNIGEAKTGAVSMSLGAVIKRHKRTLINFQQAFLIPFVTKAAWRYMQFNPEEFPASDYKFNATSTLGQIAREYEVSQLVTLLQTMDGSSPLYSVLVESVIENMNLSNREELIERLRQAQQPTEAQQAAQEAQQRMQEAQASAIEGQSAESFARAEKYKEEAQSERGKTAADLLRAVGFDEQSDNIDFERRMSMIDKYLQTEKIQLEKTKHNDQMRLSVLKDMKDSATKPPADNNSNAA